MPKRVVGRIHPLMNVPVPWVYALAFLVGLFFDHFLPLRVRGEGTIQVCRIGGLFIIIAGSLLAFTSLARFYFLRTTTVPFEKPTRLVIWGPYHFTRNPMYLGLALIYLGIDFTQAVVWPLFFLPAVLVYVHWVVIPVEEANLKKSFGRAYEKYRSKVSRWI